MTFRGFLHEVAAAERRAIRNEERRQRSLARAAKLQAKLNELERAAVEAEEYNERLQALLTIHHTVGETMDWTEIANRLAPVEPKKATPTADAAVFERDHYKPSIWQRLTGQDKTRRAELESVVVDALQRDEANYAHLLNAYRHQFARWQQLANLARAVLAREIASYRTALEALEPLAELQDLGCELEVAFPDAYTVEIDLTVEGNNVVPKETKSLTHSGKLSVKAVAQAKFYELYQDYVCGCALRAAREFQSFLPLERCIVHVKTTLLDPATGHLKELTILSVAMPRATLDQLNFAALDPSEAMTLFIHRMGFKRSQGFFAVQKLDKSEYPAI